MMTKATRHPRWSPTHEDSGTPTMFATVRPAIIIATACPRRARPTTAVPTIAPVPKNTPCGSPVTNRPRSSSSRFGAAAETRLPIA